MSLKSIIKFCAIMLCVALLCGVAGCAVAGDLTAILKGNKQLSLNESSVASTQEPSSEAVSSQKVLQNLLLYPAVGALNNEQQEIMLEYARENHTAIFNFQVRYIQDHSVASTNKILPTGHTLYEDENGRFIFSGGNVVYVKISADTSNLENPNNPIYDIGRLHDYLNLNGSQLYDENGVLISLENPADFKAITDKQGNYNNLIINAGFACELLDSTTLDVPLSVFGLTSLEDAKKRYDLTENYTMINSKKYAPVIDSDMLTLLFNGADGFLIDVKTIDTPRKTDENGVPSTLNFTSLANAAQKLYQNELKSLGINPVFEAKDIVPNEKITAYNSFSGKVEEITPLSLSKEGNLSISLDALRVLFGIDLKLETETQTLHVLTDPFGYLFIEHTLGNPTTNLTVKYIDEDAADPQFIEQQQERLTDNSYLEITAAEPGVPQPLIRTPPKSGQFTYPDSSTRIWKSRYAGKSEPLDLFPQADGDWQWNSATGFWEGISPLSGQKIVWHPSYAAAFTIR